MRAELIVDLHDLGTDVGRALGRDVAVLPSLGNVSAMWNQLGIDVTAMHIVASTDDSFSGHHTDAWWATEEVFLDDQDFEVELLRCPHGIEGPVALHDLVVTSALRRSDELAADDANDTIVIVMSNAASVASAVTHARGVPVMIAATIIHDSGLAHTRLDLSWMGLMKDRFAVISLSDVELRNGRPWLGDVAVSTPYAGTEGRDETAATLPSFAESIAIFDPEYFNVKDSSGSASPGDVGLAAVVHTLGLGSLVHIDDVSGYADRKTEVAASLYRFAADHPDAPIVVASTRPSIIAITSDLAGYGIPQPERVLRLCLPERESTYDEASFATSSAACRIVIERSLTEPLFIDDDIALDDEDADERHLQLVTGDGDVAPVRQPSPTLKLYANPNTIREESGQWREANKRRFLMLGASGAEATPADANDGSFLPISLGGCTDFTVRRPALRPGCIVEGVLHPDGDRWLIVSDPIERRRRRRPAQHEAA